MRSGHININVELGKVEVVRVSFWRMDTTQASDTMGKAVVYNISHLVVGMNDLIF